VTDVVNFQSFNRYNADVLGCSPFSFAVNLGVYLTDIPSHYPIPVRDGQPAPEEYHCHIRRRVKPIHPLLPKAADVWVIDETGLNLEDTVQAAAFELLGTGAKWFDAVAWASRLTCAEHGDWLRCACAGADRSCRQTSSSCA
jgi:hypothetical protein